MKVYIYKNNSDKLKMNKSLNLLKTVEKVHIKDNTSIIRPVLELSKDNIEDVISKANYLYISLFERYYFIDNIVFTPKRTAELHCSVDVLKTYYNSIKGKSFLIDRQEKIYSPMIVDNELPIRSERNYYRSSVNLFSSENFDKYILSVSK